MIDVGPDGQLRYLVPLVKVPREELFASMQDDKGRYMIIPQWYADLIFLPSRRSRKRPKKALYKRLLAHSRRLQDERFRTTS